MSFDLPLLVLLGDPQQLPSTVISRLAASKGYGRSLFERLYAGGVPVHMLDVQYRMHPDISSYPSATFYNMRLKDGPNVTGHASTLRPWATLLANTAMFQKLGPYAFIDVSEGGEWVPCGSTSFCNKMEAGCVKALVTSLYQGLAATSVPADAALPPLSVGVISPYNAQASLISSILGVPVSSRSSAAASSKCLTWGNSMSLQIGSVDGFQGREVDVLIFTAVRNNLVKDIGFVKNPNRQNVAITRGRHAVWVLGSKRTLEADEVWRPLITDANERGHLIQAREVELLKKSMDKVKEEEIAVANVQDAAKDAFSGTLWKVVFSQEWMGHVRKLSRKEDRAQVFASVRWLANGRRPPGYPKSTACNHASPEFRELIHVSNVIGHTLVWHIDVDRDPSACRQIIKLWALLPQSEVYTFVRRLEGGLRQYSSQHLERCKLVHCPGLGSSFTSTTPSSSRRGNSLQIGSSRAPVLPKLFPSGGSFIWWARDEAAAREGGAKPVLEHANPDE
ncbi:AAA domain-containing protein [Dunaliella salina]|uniref:AAA domain-containing protein n=1 Tax=Dunaliella salina TaxID=3046 RepID=A0ABQ7GPI9_DUNSA|nr:AAA domain-containing protein [Dunaliella salina]|eukprot:KAF5836519.1 AAA domain-containing protein [Dunaliella salina]